LVDRFGIRRMMWGSNYPNSRSDRPSGEFKGLVELARESTASLSDEERTWFFGETALSVYPWLRG
jgi:predicted TIM-barrel fold metal-dependent hydrolase